MIFLQRPLGGHLSRIAPELDTTLSGEIAVPEARSKKPTKTERLARHWNPDIHADHPRARPASHFVRTRSRLSEYAQRVSKC